MCPLMAPPGAGFSEPEWEGLQLGLLAHHFLAFLVELLPGAQFLRRFAALAAVAAAVADEVAAAGATAGAEDRGVEFLGAQLVP